VRRKHPVFALALCLVAIFAWPAVASAYKATTPWGSPALTYGFINGTSDIAGTEEQLAIQEAMDIWDTVSKVTFTENKANPSLAQIRIEWATGEHGHGQPFDGKSNCLKETGLVLAHAAYPANGGDIHFDDDELWANEFGFPCSHPTDLVSVALHELGHSLGLEHEKEKEDAIMFPGYLGHRYLDIDDILGIQSLYGYSTGLYHLRDENTAGPPENTFRYGTVLGSRSVIGDWDGDGDQTIGIYDPPEEEFYLRNHNDSGASETNFDWGKASEDKPIAGDWDGDGDQTIGMWRPSNATFYLNDQNENNAAEYTIPLGDPGDVPLAGDWDGDGDDTIGVYRPENKTFYLKNKLEEGWSEVIFVYGLAALTPVVGDWDGDGDDTIGLYDPSDGDWYLRNSNNSGAAEVEPEYGDGGDVIPVTGDWDGDGDTTIGLYQNG